MPSDRPFTRAGSLLQFQQPMWFPEVGAIPTTMKYSDYGEAGRMRVPHRYVTAPERSAGA